MNVLKKKVGNGFKLNIIVSKTIQIFKEIFCLTLAKLDIQQWTKYKTLLMNKTQ